MADGILPRVSALKKAKLDRTTEAVLLCINELVQKEFMTKTSIFIADSVFNGFGCTDRTGVHMELTDKGYEVQQIQPCRGEEGGIVISGW
jgi:hypothetical protein